MTPVVAFTPGAPVLQPSAAEVAAIHEVPIALLADTARHSTRTTTVEGYDFTDAVIDLDDHESGLEVFGLTADLVLDVVTWLAGDDRRRVPQRQRDLAHYARVGWR